jgi:anti-sigma B factor antagonist
MPVDGCERRPSCQHFQRCALSRNVEENQVDLSLETRQEGGRTIIEVGGEIDVYTAPKLRDKITELVGNGNYNLVIDMEKVEFLDSTGLGVLVGGLKKVRAHDGSMRLICNQERLLKIFRITGLAKVFVIHGSQADALAER